MYEDAPPDSVNCGPIDVSHVVSLVTPSSSSRDAVVGVQSASASSNGNGDSRKKQASDTDVSLMTKLCEIFNSSMSGAGSSNGSEKTRQKSRDSLGIASPPVFCSPCYREYVCCSQDPLPGATPMRTAANIGDLLIFWMASSDPLTS